MPKFLQGGAKVKTGVIKWCPVFNLLLDQFSFWNMEVPCDEGTLNSSIFWSCIYGFLLSLLLLQSPNMSALMKLESQVQWMPKGEWIPLLAPAVPVVLVVLQGRKLCKQVFLCMWFGAPQLHQLLLCWAECPFGSHLVKWEWKRRSAAGRKLPLLCLMQQRSPAPCLHSSLGRIGAAVLHLPPPV